MIPRRTISQPGTEQSPKEKRLRNLLQMRFMAISGDPVRLAKLDADIAILKAQLEAPKPAKTAPKPRTEPSEAEILKAIMTLLHRHPRVAKAWRQNSGVFQKRYGDKTHYIRANTAHGMSDVMGILKDGRTLAIEVKSRTGVVAAHQHEFLNSIAAAGGVAFVARDPSDVAKHLG